jgi:hypothetical protein
LGFGGGGGGGFSILGTDPLTSPPGRRPPTLGDGLNFGFSLIITIFLNCLYCFLVAVMDFAFWALILNPF